MTGSGLDSALNDLAKFVSKGPASVTLARVRNALDVTFVLLPKFTKLAFTAACEPLRIATRLTGQMLFRWRVLSEDGLPVICSNGVPVGADRLRGGHCGSAA